LAFCAQSSTVSMTGTTIKSSAKNFDEKEATYQGRTTGNTTASGE